MGLGQRGGLLSYIEQRSTMGIPLLHPWANRIARSRFPVAGGTVDLEDATTLKRDPNGLPMHGLLAAADGHPLPADWQARIARGADAPLPIAAADLAPLQGPAMGRALKAAEAAWIASAFTLPAPALIDAALMAGKDPT